MGIDPDLSPPDLGGPAAPAPPVGRTGRNLPVAIAVGVGLGGLALLTLFTVKATFLVYVAAIVGMAGWELSRALAARGIHLALVPDRKSTRLNSSHNPRSRMPSSA